MRWILVGLGLACVFSSGVLVGARADWEKAAARECLIPLAWLVFGSAIAIRGAW